MKERKQFRATDKKSNGMSMDLRKHYEILPRLEVGFYLPWYDLISFPAHLEAIEKGDVAKIYLRSKPKLVADQGGLFTLAFKFEVTSIESDCLQGRVKAVPPNLTSIGGPSLTNGTPIEVKREEIYSVHFADEKKYQGMRPEPDAFRDRSCAIHESVLKGTSPVRYFYREKTNLNLNAELPESGWCFTTETHPIREEDFHSGKVFSVPLAFSQHFILEGLSYDYGALGEILNEPLGAGFRRDPETGLFTRVTRDEKRKALHLVRAGEDTLAKLVAMGAARNATLQVTPSGAEEESTKITE